MEALQLPFLAVLPALAIVAGLKDLTSMKIPNWISGLLILGFFPAALLVGLAPMAIALHLAIGVAALLIGMALFALRLLGGGDVKLMAAACRWLGAAGSGVVVPDGDSDSVGVEVGSSVGLGCSVSVGGSWSASMMSRTCCSYAVSWAWISSSGTCAMVAP